MEKNCLTHLLIVKRPKRNALIYIILEQCLFRFFVEEHRENLSALLSFLLFNYVNLFMALSRLKEKKRKF